MALIGGIVVLALALTGMIVTALLYVGGWNGFQEEIVPGSRILPPPPYVWLLTVLGYVLPVLLAGALTAALAVRVLGLLLG